MSTLREETPVICSAVSATALVLIFHFQSHGLEATEHQLDSHPWASRRVNVTRARAVTDSLALCRSLLCGSTIDS